MRRTILSEWRRTFWAAALLLACVSCTRKAPEPIVTGFEQAEIETLKGQLADSGRSAKTKIEAAALLLNRNDPQGVAVLQRFLIDSGNRPGQLAVAEAITRNGGGPSVLIEPLFDLLLGEEPSVRVAAGRALAAYKDQEVREMLVNLTSDQEHDRQIRLVAIRSLQTVSAKSVVEAMVALLADSDRQISEAAAESLAKLTNITAFGNDTERWKLWWKRNRKKDRSEWLLDFTEALSAANTELEAENTRLRERLSQAMTDLYTATPPAQQEAVLLGFLRDPLAEVRLVATGLSDRKITTNEGISEQLVLEVREMLSDADARCRRSAAMLLANLGDADSVTALLERLKVEQASSVREGLLMALGQSRDPRALPIMLTEIASPDSRTSAAAALALGRIVEVHPPDADTKANAVDALNNRCALADKGSDDAPLREALLTAMGKVGDKDFVTGLLEGLKDEAATVRLAAVNALAKVADEAAAPKLRPLVDADPDRGVREAAVVALGALGGVEHLGAILRRTDPSAEIDPAVREGAWTVVMDILSNADAKTLRAIAEQLKDRPDAPDQRIRILQMLSDALSGTASDSEGDACRQLGLALLEANRPAEAGPHLARAWEIYQKNQNPIALVVWDEWIAGLLAADDPTAIKVMDEQEDDERFAAALQRLIERVEQLVSKNEDSSAILLAQATLKELPYRLTVDEREAIQKLLDESLAQQKQTDRREVARLVVQLRSPEEALAKSALAQLEGMGDRAVAPLLVELKAALSADHGDAKLESAILSALGRIAPDLVGYDAAGPIDEKLKLIDAWLETHR